MVHRREISKEQAVQEGAWLKHMIKSHGLKQGDLAESMEIDNPANISHWVNGRSPIPDLDLLWLAEYFKQDPFAIRPSLSDYAKYFGDSSLLNGLSETHRADVIKYASQMRALESSQAPKPMEYTQKHTKPAVIPTTGKQIKQKGKL